VSDFYIDILRISLCSIQQNDVVTAITPTPLGEGKTTTTVGLSQALKLARTVADLMGSETIRPAYLAEAK